MAKPKVTTAKKPVRSVPVAPLGVEVVGAKVTDLIPDDMNANRGTERGLAMLEDGIQKHGVGRPILVDKNGRVIGGNKTHRATVDVGIEDAIIIKSKGDKLIVHQREDVDLDTPEGRAMALEDNRIPELNLSWDADALTGLTDRGVNVAQYFKPAEIEAYQRVSREYAALEPGVEQGAFPSRRGDAPRVFPLSIVLNKQQSDRWNEKKGELGIDDDTRAFLKLMEAHHASGE